jgi:peptidoglycan/LPS O-acetylase OafA/YrhL
LGALVFYVLCVFARPMARTAFVVAVGALFALSLWQIPPHGFAPRVWLDLAVASGFALALFFARPLSTRIASHPLWRPISALGVITYSLYLVHQFNLTVATTVANRIAPHAPDLVRDGIMILVLVLIGALFWYWCERPFLNRPLTPQKPPPAEESAGITRSLAA